MDDWKRSAIQTAFWSQANNLRCEAKLCDIILYVKGKKGAMVGYPAHKVILISTSRYFKLLFDREDLRNYCHFPHLTEDGLFAVLDFIYGRKFESDTKIEDTMMAARFLQVDSAVEELQSVKSTRDAKRKRKFNESSNNDIAVESNNSKRSHVQDDSDETLTFTITTNDLDCESPDSTHQPSDLNSSYSHKTHETGHENAQADTGLSVSENQKIVIKTERTDDSIELLCESDNEQSHGSSLSSPCSQQLVGRPRQSAPSGKTETVTGALTATFRSSRSPGSVLTDSSGFPVMVVQHSSADGMLYQEEYTRKKMYSCTICGKQLGSSTGLKTHMMLHTGEKPFSCQICGQKFVHKGHLRQHTMNHNNDRPFACERCDKKFTNQAALKQHMMTHKNEVQIYSCHVCNSEFKRITDLNEHMKEHHEASSPPNE